jgi:hypothetical protein
VTSGNGSERTIWLLGPQYHAPFLGSLVPSFGLPDGPIAVVTAGWQEREGEDAELDKHLEGRSLDLELYHRADRVFRSDPEFTAGHREMQRQLKELTRLYDTRLSFMRQAVLSLLDENGDRHLLDPELDHALSQVRDLDAWQLKRIVEVRGDFEERFRPFERESIAREREEVGKIMESAAALVITGGHVAVLLNRLRLFGMGELARDKCIIAWSAGAMALTERVVLFHDHPPQGVGNSGIMEKGLGVCPRLVALPDGRKRLELEDRHRVSFFARRFEPASCIVMGEGDAIAFDGERWSAIRPAHRLGASGELETVTTW